MRSKKDTGLEGTDKEFIDLFRSLCASRSSWEVWTDLVTAMACSLSNAIDKSPAHYEKREQEYAQCIRRIGSVEKAAEALAIVTLALDKDPDQDFLGKMYMNLELSNHWKGQFFTPYSVCRMMSEITMQGDVESEVRRKGYISVCDPACGAGATLIAAANDFRRKGINFQTNVLFVGQDVDRVVAMMCYVQMSLLGCAGYICVGNTLTNPLTGHVLFPQEMEGQELWFMPMFSSWAWNTRRMLYSLGLYDNAVPVRKKEKRGEYFMIFDFEKEVQDGEYQRI